MDRSPKAGSKKVTANYGNLRSFDNNAHSGIINLQVQGNVRNTNNSKNRIKDSTINAVNAASKNFKMKKKSQSPERPIRNTA